MSSFPRWVVAGLGAIVVHGLWAILVVKGPVRRIAVPAPPTRIEIYPISMPKRPKPPSTPDDSIAQKTDTPAKKRARSRNAPQPEKETEDLEETPIPQLPFPQEPEPDVSQKPSESPSVSSKDLLRQQQDNASDSIFRRVMNQGTPKAFSPSWRVLEESLDFQSDKPVSDGERAARTATRFLEEDLAQNALSAGLANDYFRVLQNHIETVWAPNPRYLNDAGDSVSRFTMMRDSVEQQQAWGEVFKLYLDVAQAYGRGEKPKVKRKRIQRIREMFRSRKGNFRVHAIGEIQLTQDEKGRVLTLEMKISTGHPQMDENIRGAISRAVALMPPPPRRLSLGRSFRSDWRLRATWRMIPPTAVMTGASFDITPKGIDVDMPFEMKLKKKILLLGFDNRSARKVY